MEAIAEDFNTIYDPETNKAVPLNSAIGTQIIKNYLECLKNGPDSKNIISTKMFYKPRSKKNVKKKQDPYELAKLLSVDKHNLNDIFNEERQKRWKPKVNDTVFVQRSNGDWQQGILYELYKKDTTQLANVYLNTSNGKVGAKKAIPTKNLICA